MAELVSRTLLVTLPPQILGGVRTKTLFLARHLAAAGHSVSLAYYAARALRPELNASLLAKALGRPGRLDRFVDQDGFENIVVGCGAPEFEYTYTEASQGWRGIFGNYDRHVAVGGSPLIAHPLLAAGVPHLLWCADDLDGDREARVAGMFPLRRAFDRFVVQPRLARQQAAVLARTTAIRGVSNYTVDRLRAAAPPEAVNSDGRFGRLPIPVDTAFFSPVSGLPYSGRIGFAGRIGDPRKNAGLLFRTLSELRSRGRPVTLAVAGPTDAGAEKQVADAGLSDDVAFLGVLSQEDLRGFYRDLDALILPSTREGLAIAGLEAMACGVPVVSTRCGGPEDYVSDDRTGYLCDAEPAAMADAVLRILDDPERRHVMARQCRETVETEFSEPAFAKNLDAAWTKVWGEPYQAG